MTTRETTGHTPGPWVELDTESSVDLPGISGWQDIGPEGGDPVAVVLFQDRVTYRDGDATGDANARLIAAAPAMLKAMEEIAKLSADGRWTSNLLAIGRISTAAIRLATVSE